MPYYDKSEDWLHQSALLLQARPATTRITTRYHIKPGRRVAKFAKAKEAGAAAATSSSKPEETAQQQEEQKPPRGHLVLKTYDPASGVTLKYKTSKAAEVTRLVQMLGTLGRRMAGVAVETTPATTSGGGGGGGGGDEVVMGDAPPVVGGGESEAAAGGGGSGSGAQVPTPTPAAGAGSGGGGGGGKGKKKKGKR